MQRAFSSPILGLKDECDNYVGNTSPSYRTYSYYMDGSVNRVDDDSTLYVYSYDSMGRLYMEEDYRDDTGYELDFAYDRFGNRESLFAYNVDYDDWYEIAYTYDLNNRLIREDREDFIGSPGHTAGVTATTYTYDGNGSQLTKTTVDGAETRTYNGFGQLEGITGPSGSASFAYRPDGLRYRKTTGSGSAAATHIHLWDGQNIVAEVGATGALNTRYIRGTGLIAREMDGALQYYLFDAHGDVLHRLDASGNMLKTYRYDAFGNEIDPEPLDTNPFRYCGEYFDREIGTYYLRARNYDPRIGRFTTEDALRSATVSLPGDRKAVDPLSLNLYTYCHNNPVRHTDPTGLSSQKATLKGWLANNTYKLGVKGAVYRLGYEPLKRLRSRMEKLSGTYSEGVEGNATVLGIINFSGGVTSVKDLHGNSAIQVTYSVSAGAGTGVPDLTKSLDGLVEGATFKGWLSGSVVATQTITNAPDITYLEKSTIEAGGTGGADFIVGADYLRIQDENKNAYHGGTIKSGIGKGFELHVGPTITSTFLHQNIFDQLEGLYRKMLEW